MNNTILAQKTDNCQVKTLDIDKNFLSIFDNTLPKFGKHVEKNNQGHVYVGSLIAGKMAQKTAFTLEGLKSMADEQYTTASAFFSTKAGRTAKNLRWTNALTLDFDIGKNGKEIDVDEIVVRIADAGLPAASMLVRTPSGGIHAWWFLKPVRATPRAIRLFTALQSSMAQELRADMAAIGAERFWRLPISANIIYSGSKKYKLSTFRNWRDENRPQDRPGQPGNGQVYAFTAGLLAHPTVKKLQSGVKKGQRNNACFALAVAHLISGYSVHETTQILLSWNQKNSPPMGENEVLKCLNSASRGLQKNYQHYYNAMRFRIKNITGITVKYRPLTPARPRNERKRSHLHERKQDLILHLQKRGKKKMTTLRRFAEKLNMPFSSLKVVLNELEKEKVIYRDSVKRGRKSFTILILRNANKSAFLMGHIGTHYRCAPGQVNAGINLDSGQVPTSRLSGGLDECLLL